jgi:hypothetical protein
MLLDSQLAFSPLGYTLSLVAGAGVSVIAPNPIDLLGTGVGTPPQSIFGSTASVFGEDPGIGNPKIELQANIGVAPVSANGATVNMQIQAAQDPGAAGNYTPTSWTTVVETGGLALANLLVPTNAKAAPLRLTLLPVFPPGFLPRFLRLAFAFPAGTNLTAGTITFAGIVNGRDDWQAKFAARNYVVS